MNVRPKLEEILGLSSDHTHVTLWAELLIDTETPISLYEKLAGSGSLADKAGGSGSLADKAGGSGSLADKAGGSGSLADKAGGSGSLADKAAYGGEPCSFLLESAEGGETFGRYSFIGFGPARTFRFSRGQGVIRDAEGERTVPVADPLLVLEGMLRAYRVRPEPSLPRFIGGAVGYLGYDAVRYFERVPVPEGEPLGIPEGYFMLAERLVIVDHLRHRVILVDHMPLAGDRASAYAAASLRLQEVIERVARASRVEPAFFSRPAAPTTPAELAVRFGTRKDDYLAGVEKAKDAIRAGEIFQVVLSQRFVIERAVPSFDIYRALRALNPSPYMFHLAFEDLAVVGASPEVLVRLDGDEILLRPIAGTRPRGRTRADDLELESDLLGDEKELAEHKMLLDLGRNDVGRIARLGSVEVDRPLHIERYSHVMHIVSDVRGRLAEGKTSFDVLRACFPAGTVSGAPKIRAMELIAALETGQRGLYSGAVGYFDFGGNMDTCIAIRSLVVARDKLYLQAGGGVVFDSVPENEFQESLNKADACFQAVALAEAMGRQRVPIEDQPTNPLPLVLLNGADASQMDGADASQMDGADASQMDGADASQMDGADASQMDGADASQMDGADASQMDGADAVAAAGASELDARTDDLAPATDDLASTAETAPEVARIERGAEQT